RAQVVLVPQQRLVGAVAPDAAVQHLDRHTERGRERPGGEGGVGLVLVDLEAGRLGVAEQQHPVPAGRHGHDLGPPESERVDADLAPELDGERPGADVGTVGTGLQGPAEGGVVPPEELGLGVDGVDRLVAGQPEDTSNSRRKTSVEPAKRPSFMPHSRSHRRRAVGGAGSAGRTSGVASSVPCTPCLPAPTDPGRDRTRSGGATRWFPSRTASFSSSLGADSSTAGWVAPGIARTPWPWRFANLGVTIIGPRPLWVVGRVSRRSAVDIGHGVLLPRRCGASKRAGAPPGPPGGAPDARSGYGWRLLAGRDLLDGGPDAEVRTAPAQVPAHRLVDVGVGRVRVLVEERHGLHDLARLAVAALGHVVVDPGLLHGVQLVALGQPLDRGHAPALDGAHRRDAGPLRHTVDVARAGAAEAHATAVLQAMNVETVTKNPQELLVVVGVDGDRVAVECEGDVGHGNQAPYSLSGKFRGFLPVARRQALAAAADAAGIPSSPMPPGSTLELGTMWTVASSGESNIRDHL